MRRARKHIFGQASSSELAVLPNRGSQHVFETRVAFDVNATLNLHNSSLEKTKIAIYFPQLELIKGMYSSKWRSNTVSCELPEV